MPRELGTYLWDILQAGREVLTFVGEMDFPAFAQDPLLRAAVERKLEIIGEALAQALKHFPDLRESFPEAPKVIAMRNRLIHAYAQVDPAVVYGVVRGHLPELLVKVEAKLQGLGEARDIDAP
ncbi:DUF86 domain-containing protein [Thermus tengchongensis]|uniref:DUF86 domain-containing protein n=1 Tax=Thermus tengchongensis TaxID=1214928 RepID=A0A4Y9FE46_9DEIN|nr:HepT-like ribonuclease domain-containing protein [Thermus tengchongensis]TFU27406.1 DUF86 domain-containing protein [Thermus tengchongensis]